jgi:hypothetical protein
MVRRGDQAVEGGPADQHDIVVGDRNGVWRERVAQGVGTSSGPLSVHTDTSELVAPRSTPTIALMKSRMWGRRCGTYSTMTFAPIRARSNRSMTSSLNMRMQPEEAWVPIVQGSLVPWMR